MLQGINVKNVISMNAFYKMDKLRFDLKERIITGNKHYLKTS